MRFSRQFGRHLLINSVLTKTVLITGASSGIGGIGRLFAKDRCHLVQSWSPARSWRGIAVALQLVEVVAEAGGQGDRKVGSGHLQDQLAHRFGQFLTVRDQD